MSNALNLLLLFDRRRRLYQRVYASPDGRALLEDILEKCRFGKPSQAFNEKAGALDPLALAVAEGRRDVAAHIVRLLGVPDLEMQLRIQEAQGAKQRGEQEYEY